MRDAFHFDTLVWDWPIAVYLFLIGLSAGLVLISILLKYNVPEKGGTRDRVMKVAAIIAPLVVILGLLILIHHLTKPFSFWLLLIFYNPSSIMSLGVILLVIYTALLFVWMTVVYRDEFMRWIDSGSKSLKLIKSLLKTAIGITSKIEKPLDYLLVFLAVLLGCYTGFLLSALKSYPLLNNPVLPILFLVSGLSSGIAVAMITAATQKSDARHDKGMAIMHKVETPVVFIEMFVLFAFFVGLFLGRGQSVVAATTALSGFWGNIFWLGVIGLGMLVPLVLGKICSKGIKSHFAFMIGTATFTLIGVFLLRLFILYTGQMTVA